MSGQVNEAREISRALLRFNAHVFGVTIAVLAASGLFVATLVMSFQGNTNPDGLLALLRHFLPGYKISATGAFVGALWAATIGYGTGAIVGFGYGPWLLREATRARDASGGDEIGQRVALLRPLPFAITTGCVLAAGLFLATNWLWFRYGVPSPNLELLRHYLPGYTTDFGGSVIGAFWMFGYGALAAAGVAWIYDRVVAIRFPTA
jgi:hypothetical protein